MIFELLTAEYLFDPQSQSDVFGKDDDHMAQIIELLGDFDPDMKFGGRYSREIFDSNGASSFFCSCFKYVPSLSGGALGSGT